MCSAARKGVNSARSVVYLRRVWGEGPPSTPRYSRNEPTAASILRSRDRGSHFLPVPALLADALPGDLAAPGDPLGHERRRTLRARLRHRARPHREGAGRVVRARVEGLALPGALLGQLAAAARLRAPDPEGDRLCGLTLPIARAR